jgi:ribosomal protein L7/L12
MKLTLTLEGDSNLINVTQDVRGWTKEQIQDFVGRSYDLFKSADKNGKHLVLTGMVRSNRIPYIKAVRDGSGVLGLKEAKDLVEACEAKNRVLEVPCDQFDGILRACEKAGLSAHLLTIDEVACLEVHES